MLDIAVEHIVDPNIQLAVGDEMVDRNIQVQISIAWLFIIREYGSVPVILFTDNLQPARDSNYIEDIPDS